MIKECSKVTDFQKYKVRKQAALRYWNMTRCSYVKLAEYMSISLIRAKRFEKEFTELLIKRGKENANKR